MSPTFVLPDVHGDYDKALRALALTGVVDASTGEWVAAAGTVVVQLGDQVDSLPRDPALAVQHRGPADCARAIENDLAVVRLFDGLADAAARAGCAAVSLLGNHEMMNLAGDVRYADVCAACSGARVAAFRPGGDVARALSRRPVVARCDGVLYAHAGLTPGFAARHGGDMDALNAAVARFLRGGGDPNDAAAFRACLNDADGPCWTRAYAPKDHETSDRGVTRMLARCGCSMMVVGHNAHVGPGRGVTPAHAGRVWVLDPGMSASVLGSAPAALRVDRRERVQRVVRGGRVDRTIGSAIGSTIGSGGSVYEVRVLRER